MGKLLAAVVAVLTTLAGIAWFYNVLYGWAWCGLIASTAIGWVVGYALIFVLLIVLTPFVCVGLGLLLVLAASEWEWS